MEGCGYRDLKSEFDALGVEIVGVSFDSPAANQAWAEDEGYTFELWTDDERTLAIAYGAAASADASYALRLTVVLDENGDCILTYDVGANLGTHPAMVLEDLEQVLER